MENTDEQKQKEQEKKKGKDERTKKRLLERAARIKIKIELMQQKIAQKKKPWFGTYEEKIQKLQEEAAEIQAALQSLST